MLEKFCPTEPTTLPACPLPPGTPGNGKKSTFLANSGFSFWMFDDSQVPISSMAAFDELLQIFAGLDEGRVGKAATRRAGNGFAEHLRSANAVDEVHVVHRTGPLGLVGQGKRGHVVGLERLDELHQFGPGLGRREPEL